MLFMSCNIRSYRHRPIKYSVVLYDSNYKVLVKKYRLVRCYFNIESVDFYVKNKIGFNIYKASYHDTLYKIIAGINNTNLKFKSKQDSIDLAKEITYYYHSYGN